MDCQKLDAAGLNIDQMILVYKFIINALRDKCDDSGRLERLLESLERSMSQLYEIRESGVDARTEGKILRGLREGLKDFPGIIIPTLQNDGGGIVKGVAKYLSEMKNQPTHK